MEEILPRLGWLLCAGQPRVKCGRADLRIFWTWKWRNLTVNPTLTLTLGNRTLRTQDTSAPVPKCLLDTSALMRRRIARCCFVGWGLVNQSAATHCLLGGRRPVYLKMPVGERWSGCRRLVYGSDRVSPRNYTKVALPLSVIPHVLSLSIWPSGRLHRSRQTRAKTLRHLGRDSSALGARQFGT